KPAFRRGPAWRVSQSYLIETRQIDTGEQTASEGGNLLAGGGDVSLSSIEYLPTGFTKAKFAALPLALAGGPQRASTIAAGLDAVSGRSRRRRWACTRSRRATRPR